MTILALAIAGQPLMFGQDKKTLTLEQAVELALQNNHLLNVRKYQVEEKQQKVSEDKVKYFPAVTVAGSYQYNANLPKLTLLQGSFGQLPLGGVVIQLPPTDYFLELGKHSIYNAGVAFYQPISQLPKINKGVQISKTELQIAQTEQNKTIFQVKQGVEKLYFGLLILKKQIEEAEIKVILARTKLYDIESAVTAGKTTESNRYGLSALEADEEQNLLKLKMQYDDYSDDMKHLIGLDDTLALEPEAIDIENSMSDLPAIDTSIITAALKNNDLKMASLSNSKADYSIKAGKFGYLPDVGILGGYTYQEGNTLYPANNTFIGASLKWNIQDVFSNRMILRQRTFMKRQTEENLANTREQVNNDIAKAYRKLRQSKELISVSGKVVEYRREDLKIQNDRRMSGLNLESDLLSAKAAMAKAESDFFTARLSYRIALSDLKILTGSY
jgi:outer membrane protein